MVSAYQNGPSRVDRITAFFNLSSFVCYCSLKYASLLAARYVDQILRGAKPSELPVQLPTKYLMVINLTTAKALGLTVPPTFLATADEVIE
jgi:putative ABC transport system substrate-binding protein